MKDYKRMTTRNEYGTYSIVGDHLDEVVKKRNEQEPKPLIEQLDGTQWLVDFLDKLVCAERNALLCCQKLGEIEDKIEQGTLVDIKTVAKFVSRLLMEESPCPCDLALFGEAVDSYMIDHCDDWCWCEKNCDTVFKANDYTPCWEKYLTAKLKELQGAKR